MNANAKQSVTGRRVVKLGGSLLTTPGLRELVNRWLDIQSPMQNVVFIGGGGIVDAVRDLDAIYPLAEKESHWICIELLGITHRYAQAMFPDWTSIGLPSELAALSVDHPTPYLINVSAFYDETIALDVSHPASLLECNWSTTSDALAGLLAVQTQATELVLLKSCEVPTTDIRELCRLEIVDTELLKLVSRLPRIRVERLAYSPFDPNDVETRRRLIGEVN